MKKNLLKSGFVNSTSDLHFFVEFNSLEKAKDKDGKEILKVGGIASTSDIDKEGEVLDPAGFDFQPFLNNGYFNWHHQSAKSPITIIGEPTSAKVTPEGFYVEGELYADNPVAQQVWDLAQILKKNSKKRRLGFSIEGKATQRNLLNPKKVEKATITGCAITHAPINGNTLMNLIKGDASDEPPMFEIIDSVKSPGGANGGYLIHLEKPDGTFVSVDTDYNIVIKAPASSGAMAISENNTVDKAMTTVSAAAIIPESLDSDLKDKKRGVGDDKINKAKIWFSENRGKIFTKSQLPMKIKSDFSDIEFSKADIDVFINLLESLNKEKEIMKNLFLQDDISKAYKALGLNIPNSADDIQKADVDSDKEEEGDDEKKPKMYFKKNESGSYCKMKKATKDGEEDERADDDEYSKEEDNSFKKMKKSKNVMSKADDDIVLITSDTIIHDDVINKADVVDDDGEVFDLKKAFDSLVAANNQQFRNLAIIMKAETETLIKSYQEENEDLRKRMNELESSPVINSTLRKAGTLSALERLHNAENPGKEQNGKVLSQSLQKASVISLLDQLSFEKGDIDSEYSQAMMGLEAGVKLSPRTIARIQNERGIQIVQ